VSTIFCYHRPGEGGSRPTAQPPLALSAVMEGMPAPAAIGITLTNEAVIKHLLGEVVGSRGGCVLAVELPSLPWSCRLIAQHGEYTLTALSSSSIMGY